MVALRNEINLYGGSLEKDTVGNPSGTTDLLYGNKNQGQIFTFCAGDIVSEVVSGGSPLMQWIPARGVDTWNEHVAHITWVAPEGFTGATSYMDYLAAQDAVGECDFGEGFDYQYYEYSHTMHRVTVSNKNKPLRYEHFGMRQCDKQPQLRIRGNDAGIAIDNDGEWTLARLAIGLEHHLDWNLIHGDPTIATGNGMYDGLDNIISTNWVRNHLVGGGDATFSDPIIYNGISLTTPGEILRVVKAIVRKLRTRMFERGYIPRGDDMAIVMSPAHWSVIADAIACGALTGSCAVDLSNGLNPEVWQRERDRITRSGVGYGFIQIDGIPVPVIPETNLGYNVTLEDDQPGVHGDIYILTKRFRGDTILEHQYLNWNLMDVPSAMAERSTIFQNGMIKATWVDLNGLCFYYGEEMQARIVSRYQPMQAKIINVTVETVLENENESISFASPDYYAFNGESGGAGVALLTPFS